MNSISLIMLFFYHISLIMLEYMILLLWTAGPALCLVHHTRLDRVDVCGMKNGNRAELKLDGKNMM